jgi:hypothetical protein
MPQLLQIPNENWRADGAIALCTLPFLPKAVSELTGVQFQRTIDQLGYVDVATVSLDGDVLWFEGRPEGFVSGESVFVTVSARGDVRDLDRALQNILCSVSLADNQLLWKQPDMSRREWILFRLDDNGNRFVMSYFRDKGFAERLAALYESKGHKQTYYVSHTL